MRQHWRFVIAVVLLGMTGLVLQARNSTEIIPSRPPLASFPRTLGGWESRDIELTQDVLDTLGNGDFLLRDYQNPHDYRNVFLFVAYFASQRTGDTIHSPKNCLPGAGWAPVKADRVTIDAPGHSPFQANRYVIARGDERQLVLYWYWAHGRAVASEYSAKFYLIADSIRMRRTDGSLVRLSMPLAPGQSVESAQQELASWAGKIVPLLDTYVPK